MYQEVQSVQKDTPAWLFFVKVTFAVSIVATTIGIFFLPVDIWVKGYMAIGLYFCVGSTITLSKTLRDEHESTRVINKIRDVKTEKILKEYEMNDR